MNQKVKQKQSKQKNAAVAKRKRMNGEHLNWQALKAVWEKQTIRKTGKNKNKGVFFFFCFLRDEDTENIFKVPFLTFFLLSPR